MRDIAGTIREDKTLWEKRDIEGVGGVLLVEESYYDGIVQDALKIQEENEQLRRNHAMYQRNWEWLIGENKKLEEENERYKKRNKKLVKQHSTVCNQLDLLKKGKMTIEELSK